MMRFREERFYFSLPFFRRDHREDHAHLKERCTKSEDSSWKRVAITYKSSCTLSTHRVKAFQVFSLETLRREPLRGSAERLSRVKEMSNEGSKDAEDFYEDGDR